MSTDFECLTVVVSGPLYELARFQLVLEQLNGELNLQRGEGADDGLVGVLRWCGVRALPPPFAVRGRYARKKIDDK